MKNRIQLNDGWRMQPASKITLTPQALSIPGSDTSSWYEALVPGTVLGALVKLGVIKEPFRDKNLAQIPEMMFAEPWWFRTEFETAQAGDMNFADLELDGVNYRAEIWLNGKQIASDQECVGAFRRWQFDIAKELTIGKNVLAIKISPPQAGDFSIGFVDWNPPSPDKNMGIFRPIQVHHFGGIKLEHPFVDTAFHDDFSLVRLQINATLENHTSEKTKCDLCIDVDGINVCKSIELLPNQSLDVILSHKEFPQLQIENPRLWWPNNLGEPALYKLNLSVETESGVSDSQSVQFGMRKIESWLNAEGNRVFAVNGRETLIKGGGWTDDLFLLDDDKSLAAQIRYVKDLNLNCIRLEGFWGKDHKLYDLCDQNGILMMVGWSCHWEHEQYLGKPIDIRFGGVTEPEEIDLIAKSFRDQVLWLRNHPAIFCWTLASDMVPHPDLESRYIEILKSCDPTRPSLNSTGGVGSEQAIVTSTVIESDITGSSGLKMLGPYAYTPPVYWYTDKRLGGAYGFNSETCPGANVPPIDSLRKMLSEENLWPMNSAWDFHGGRNAFATLDRIVEAIAKRYGTAESAEDFAFKAQVLNYELMRPMFEAFQINHPRATGIIQWMLNAAWPKTSWQLYDQYLRPNGAFYGAKKGCTPQKLAYNYGDGDVYFVDEYAQNNTPKIAWIRQYDTASQLLLEETVRIKPKSGTTRVFRLKRPNKLIFLDLRLLDADCDELHHNFYWLAPTPDVLNYGAKFDDWAFYTPTKSYANFHDLNKMPKTSLDVDAEMSAGEHDIEMSVEITNHSEILAFFNEFIVIDPSSDTHVLPSNWSDNYISLLPGESRKVRVSFPRHAIGRVDPIIALNGWNLD